MSQYTDFFLKGDDKFYSLGSWGRSSTIAYFANNFCANRYGTAKRFTSTMLSDLENQARNKARITNDEIKAHQKRIAEIGNYNNSIDEKLNCIREYEELISDLEEEKEACEYACNYFGFLVELENPVYVGLECGEQPDEVID